MGPMRLFPSGRAYTTQINMQRSRYAECATASSKVCVRARMPTRETQSLPFTGLNTFESATSTPI
jgi:hypothetical protein